MKDIDPTAYEIYKSLFARDKRRFIREGAIEAAHPKWREDVNSTSFDLWLRTPVGKKHKHLADSPKAKDAIRLLDLYKFYLRVLANGGVQ